MPAADKNKLSSVENALSQIQRQFGKGAIMRLGSDETELVPAIPTGALSLDIALGVGGLPRGRVSEIYGPESSGKTTLALHVIAEAQKEVGPQHLSMPNTPLIPIMPKGSESTSMTCWFHNPILENRLSR